jgi:hypothetical protein
MTHYAWDDHTELNEQVERLLAASERRRSQYRKLGRVGVRKPIAGGCGSVRVNAYSEVLAIELDLNNARAAGEQRLAGWVLAAIRDAAAQAARVDQLIANQH